jgi:hypothetical protein
MTDRTPGPDAQFSALLSRFPPEIVALADACLPKLRRALPGVPQLVYDYRNSLVVSFSPSERGYEGVVAVAIDPRGVRLYVAKDVPDPNGRLEGSGGKVRSVAVESASDLDRGDVHELVQAAIRLSGAKFQGAGPGRMIIQSESKKKTPRSKSSSSKKARSSKRSG